MRRPQQDHHHLHSNHHHHHHHHHNHHYYHQQHHHHHHGSSSSPTRSRQVHDKDESRLAKVKRVLTVSLLRRNAGSTRVFGTRLDSIEPYLDTGVPFVVHRLCNYIEAHGFQSAAVFRLSGGSPRLAERLRAAFERRGDADLETAACPPTAATLLRQYLKELPQPVVPSTLVARLLSIHAQNYANDHDCWINLTKELLSTLPTSHYRLLGYLALYLSKYEAKHGRSAGVCGVFAPVILPHVPPATTLLRDILAEASVLFPDCIRDNVVNGVISASDCKICKDTKDEPKDFEGASLLCALKPRKRKERHESCCQERKLIRSSSEERVLESPAETTDTIRRVSSHEDFNSEKHLHILSQLGQDMGHGVRCGSLPLHERTNVSPVSKKTPPTSSPCETALETEKFECDAEKLRSSERFSRSITPRGRRQARRRRVHKVTDAENSSKENEEETDNIYVSSNPNSCNGSPAQSFLEMLSSGPSRSPSPARPPTVSHEDLNNPSLTNWTFQRQENDEAADARVEAMLSPRNSLLLPRRFYSENEMQPNAPNIAELGLKNLTKYINGLKKKIKKYEDEFEENFGYRPSHSDKMSNKDIKRLCTELSKLRKEHKLLKEDPVSALLANANNKTRTTTNGSPTNNNNSQEKSRTVSMEEMIKEIEKKLSEKRLKYNRPENMEELTYEQLIDEKTAVQKALLHIENTFGRPVSKEDRAVVRSLYDKYRTLKRLLIRAGVSKNKDSISELATILEHEAMDFTSSNLPNNPSDTERRASEPDMSHRGILDCIDSVDQLPTDSDSQHSSSEGSRSNNESLHALPQEELLVQQKLTREEKKRLRRALKELEAQFEARAGRRMQREDRGPQVTTVYESYKQAKAKLRLIDALVAKNA
ncbi:protein FAM13A [Bombus vancouverensis nearcticus]|uniref:Protein FAM13B n=1 Tax=Bombus bifarius TaxID=103933 RepID=A0A6P8MXF8_9HYME|nr:protein FAM13B [Bombus vancouverensis nearcticus]XP_033307412.1 protein FAM13B [Bombus bifarius]XP_050476385.1 protein FAM13B [Bombus huntii]